MSSNVTIPLEAPFSSAHELLKGCTFFIALVAVISGLNGLIVLFSDSRRGRAVLIFSAAMWILWIAVRAIQLRRERARTAQPSGQIRISSAEISVPSIMGDIQSIRWTDLKSVRLTREIDGSVYYEFYSTAESPAILIPRRRVKDPAALDRELESRAGGVIERTFEVERPSPTPPHGDTAEDIQTGDRFKITLPPTGWTTLRGCGGFLMALAVVVALAFRYSDLALKWMGSGAGMALVVAILIIGIFLAGRTPRAWIICGTDGMHVHAPGRSFPALIRWSDLLDYTYVRVGGRRVTHDLTVWTSGGSWKLQGITIDNETSFLLILRQRSARTPRSFVERSGHGALDS